MQMKWASVTLAAVLVVACGEKEAVPAATAPSVPVAEAPAPARTALVTDTPTSTPTVDDSKKEAACKAESMEGYGTGVIAGQRMSKTDEDFATHLIYKQCMSR